MATCDPQALLNAANCFDCLTSQQLEQVQVQMLCDLVNGGLAGGPFVRISGDTMTGPLLINSAGMRFSVNTSNLRVESNGFVGVNCSSASAPLQVGNGVPLFNFGTLSILGNYFTVCDGTREFLVGVDGTMVGGIAGATLIDSITNHGIAFFTNNSPVGCFTTTARFGVGTLNPVSKTDIVGNLTVGATYGGVNAAPTSGAIIEGRVGIGTNAPNANALLDLVSTTLGFKLPTMTTAQKNAIANTAGLMVFDTDLGKACVNNGAGWQTITSA